MDPKILQILRTLFGVDNKLLPDSMTTEEFGTFIDEQKGKLFGNPEDIKNLQKIISQKDVDLQKVAADLKKFTDKKVKTDPNKSKLQKDYDGLAKQLKGIEKQLKKINLGKERSALKKQYPDILPQLLIGHSEETIKVIVEEQRNLNKKLYGEAKHFTQPKYEDAEQIDREIDEIKNDPKIGGVEAAKKVLELNREKENLESAS